MIITLIGIVIGWYLSIAVRQLLRCTEKRSKLCLYCGSTRLRGLPVCHAHMPPPPPPTPIK